jgi:hypothetical protein
MAVTSLRVDTRFSSGKWVLLAAGASSIVVGSVGVVVGRSSTVCGVFVVVGLALLGASAVATYGHEQGLPIVAGLVTVGPAPSDVVIDNDRVVAVASDEASRRLAQQDRDTHRAHTQLASATYLALLVVVAIVLVLGATLAVVVVVLVLLGGL